MLIEYKNLKIRNATSQDAEQLMLWWNDGSVMAHAGFPNGLGVTAESIAESISIDSDHARRRLIIEINDIPVGEMVYRFVDDRSAEIGIKICEFSMQNKGYGKILLSMLINMLFNDLYCEKIILDTNLKNKRAQHVYESLGFVKKRINIDSWQDQLGEWQSSVDYELCRSSFISFLN